MSNSQEVLHDSFISETNQKTVPISLIIKEILAEQSDIMKNWIVDAIKDKKKKKEISSMTKQDFDKFCHDEKNKEYISNALNNKELESKYRPLIEKSQLRLQEKIDSYVKMPIDKTASKIEEGEYRKTIINDIKTPEGKVAITLSEKISKSKEHVALANDAVCNLSGSRSIAIPDKMNEGVNGPMTLSFALYDQDGKPAPKTVPNFVVNYGKDGTLSEFSCPGPVKFAAKSGGSVGYIEIEGKAYTIPVDRQQFQDLEKATQQNMFSANMIKTETFEKNLGRQNVQNGFESNDHTIREYIDKFNSKLNKINHEGVRDQLKQIESKWKNSMKNILETVKEHDITKLTSITSKTYNALIQSVLNDFEPVQNRIENISRSYGNNENKKSVSEEHRSEINKMIEGLADKMPEIIDKRANFINNALKLDAKISRQERTSIIHNTLKEVSKTNPSMEDLAQKFERGMKKNKEYQFSLSKDSADKIFEKLVNIEIDHKNTNIDQEIQKIRDITNKKLGITRKVSSRIRQAIDSKSKKNVTWQKPVIEINKEKKTDSDIKIGSNIEKTKTNWKKVETNSKTKKGNIQIRRNRTNTDSFNEEEISNMVKEFENLEFDKSEVENVKKTYHMKENKDVKELIDIRNNVQDNLKKSNTNHKKNDSNEQILSKKNNPSRNF